MNNRRTKSSGDLLHNRQQRHFLNGPVNPSSNQMNEISFKIVEILELLGFNRFVSKQSPNTKITPKSFEKLKPLEFRLIYYFLFYLTNRDSTKARFRNVYPSKDIQQETEFRKITVNWLEEIKSKLPGNVDKIPMIHFQRLSGQQFIELTFKFVVFVLNKEVSKSNSNPPAQDDKSVNVEQYKQYVSDFEEKLNDLRKKLDDAQIECDENLENVNQKLSHLQSRYHSVEFLEQVSDKLRTQLEADLSYLKGIIQWSRARKIDNDLTKSLNSSGNQAIISDNNIGKLIIDKLEQLDRLADFISVNNDDFAEALHNYKILNTAITQLDHGIESSNHAIEIKKAELEKVKEDLLKTETAQTLKETIKNQYKSLFDLSLSFSSYGLNELLQKYQ